MTQQGWIPQDRAWLDGLEEQLAQRRAQIAQRALHPDNYPPLPECPQCEQPPEAIRSGDPTHPDIFLTGDVVLRFEPCRHTFRVEGCP